MTRLQNFVLNIKVILLLEMIEYHASEETSNSCSDDGYFKLWRLQVVMAMT